MDIKELETADYDILENVKTAFYRLWKLKIVVVLMTLIGILASVLYISMVGVYTNYRSSATIYSAVYGSSEETNAGVAMMNTYASLLGSTRVCERAANSIIDTNITAAQLRSMVNSGHIFISGASTSSKSYSYKLTLVVVSSDPQYVAVTANAMAQAFVNEINELQGTSTLQVLDEARGISSYKTLNVQLYVILFAAVAFIGSAGVIFVKEFFSPYVYSVAQCESDKEQILGLVPYKRD